MKHFGNTAAMQQLNDGISRSLIQLMLRHGVLSFGQFELPCGRTSPYFVDFSRFHTGTASFRLGKLYADKIDSAFLNVPFDIVFGAPGYGMSLATHAAASLSQGARNVKWGFMSKPPFSRELPDALSGAPIEGTRVLFVSDVLTVGGAMEEAYSAVVAAGGIPVGAVVGFDRMESSDDSPYSALSRCGRKLGIPIVSIASFDQLFADMQSFPSDLYVDESGEILQRLEDYRAKYGSDESLVPLF